MMMQYGWRIFIFLIAVAALCNPIAGASSDISYNPHELAIRQAHLELGAFTTETEMEAAISYIYPLYSTDTTRLNALLENFKEMEARIPGTTSPAGFENLTGQMRAITAEFRNESETQMTIGYGKWDDLSRQIGAATTNNPYIEQKQQAYWSTRRTNQLEVFDTWVLETQASLDALKTQGFDMATAQRSLDVIGSKRPDLVSALDSKSEDRIASVNGVILPLTRELGAQVQVAQAKVSEVERMQFLVDQGNRGVVQADRINNNLIVILLDIGPAEPALRSMKTNLATADRLLASGNIAAAKTPFLLLKRDYKDLSMAYRDLANTADLPPDLAAALRAMVITLDTTADQIEVQ